jgi:NAD(P)-dependent dehydrogenase (short-subunit alcohol dehydrogenase family)
VLNGVIALHECDGAGYRQMAATPTGWALPLALLGWIIGLAVSLAVTIPWLCWQFLAYVGGTPFRAKEDLTGKRVLITGVTRGLGMDLMLHCLERGAEVIGTTRTHDTLRDLQARLPASAPVRLLTADLSRPQALVTSLTEAQVPASSIDIAVLCAGVKYPETSVLSLPQLRDTFQVNLFSAAEFAAWFVAFGDQAPRPSSRESGASTRPAVNTPIADEKANADTASRLSSAKAAGHPRRCPNRTLVIVSSMGRWHGMHFSCGYNASKAGLSIWAESLEMEMRPRGASRLHVMTVEPGMFESGMAQQTGMAKLLFASRRTVARRIMCGALTEKRSIRPPFWFALLTWGVCLGGRGLRYRLFTRVNK